MRHANPVEGPLTSADLAAKTNTNERYVREWLNSQAAGGYVEHDADTGRYFLREVRGRSSEKLPRLRLRLRHLDCLHDMGDPVGAAAHVRNSLRDDGTWMIVEPFASDRVEDNHNPIGRIYYSASTLLCTPASRSQEVGLALGAQAGEARVREVVLAGGFREFRRATQTPFNIIYEAKL